MFPSLKKWLLSCILKVCAPDANVSAKKRRGATAMEYLVVISFILVVLIASVQTIGGTTKGLFNKSVTATSAS